MDEKKWSYCISPQSLDPRKEAALFGFHIQILNCQWQALTPINTVCSRNDLIEIEGFRINLQDRTTPEEQKCLVKSSGIQV